MAFKLFIFDFDGTLADSGPWMLDALNRAAARFGFREVTVAEAEALRGRDNRAIIRELGVPWWRLPQIAAYIRQLAQEATSAPLFLGVASMLRDVHAAGVKLAIVSSNAEETIRRALGDDCAPLIHAYACNASLFGKAAKFKRVLKLTGVARDQAIAVGDEVRDIEAARAAGLVCGAVAWGYATPAILQAQGPDLFFNTPGDIAALALRRRC